MNPRYSNDYDPVLRPNTGCFLSDPVLAYDSARGRDAESPEDVDGDAHARFTAWLRDRLNPEDARVAEQMLAECLNMPRARDDEPANMEPRGAARNPEPTDRNPRQLGMASDEALRRNVYQQRLFERLAMRPAALRDFAERWPDAKRIRGA